MIYYLLKPLVRTALKLYFRRIEIRGLEAADPAAPMLILANHTASFMDALLTACFVKRRINFFARGDVFANPLADRILRSIGLMPVYRLSEGRDKLSENDRSNEEAIRILQQGGAVLIFAEGISHTDKVLKPLKKGPFRLAVAASVVVPKSIQILPLGINYVYPDAPLGDAFLEAAPAFVVSEEESVANPVAMATSLMRQTASLLQPLCWDVQDPSLRPFADKSLHLLSKSNPRFTFLESQILIGQLQNDPTGTLARQQILADEKQTGTISLKQVLVAPFALLGYAGNFLPLRLAKWIADTQVKHADFWAPVFVCSSIIAVLLWYVLILVTGSISGYPGWTLLALTIISLGGVGYVKMFANKHSATSV